MARRCDERCAEVINGIRDVKSSYMRSGADPIDIISERLKGGSSSGVWRVKME